MTNAELIAKAKEHARLFLKEMPVNPKIIEGKTRVRDAVIIYFAGENNSVLQVTLDKETGEFITAES